MALHLEKGLRTVDVTNLSHPQACALLQDGVIRRQRGMLAGWNSNFLLEIGNEAGLACLAVYKPCRGESHLWDFPPGTLYQREYLAYRLSEALGWGLVPPTVVREGPHGVGSVQLFIKAEPSKHYFNLVQQHRQHMVRVAVFDCVINNADRKGGHVLLDPRGHIWAIDHGLCLHSEPKLRTVMWDLDDEPVPDALRRGMAGLFDRDGLRDELGEYLTPRETDALFERVACVMESPTIPLRRLADSWRPYPWPPI